MAGSKIATIGAACLLAAGAALPPRGAAASDVGGKPGGDSAAVAVGARVVSSARLETVRSVRALTLTPEDVGRGYVEIEHATSVVVKTNSPTGYFLEVEIASEMIRGAQVLGLPGGAFVASDDGRVIRPTRGPLVERLDLGFRFELSQRAEPGVYPWPVSLTVSTR
ncbi:MAG: hypothetical protein LAO51_00755 [Acidobacteriia bacterium]|nr:hypothetical protein [Terriglobia bacterium]